MKSHYAKAVSIYVGIFEDASIVWSSDRTSIEKDMSYLRRACENRGMSFLTLTLPSLGKWLDKSLDHGAIIADPIPRGIKARNGRPIFMGSFLDRIFSPDGVLRSDACCNSISFYRQVAYLCKKYRMKCSPQAEKETLDEFFSIEEHLPTSHPDTWDCEEPIWTDRYGHPLWGIRTDQKTQEDLLPETRIDHCDYPWDRLRLLSRRLISEFGPINWWDLEPKHGPGVNSEREGFVSKYEFPHWPRKLGVWFPFDWFGSGSLEPYRNSSWKGDIHFGGTICYPSDREPPARLITVPKTVKGPRLICAEPVAHQWMQQSIWRWLAGRVESHSCFSNSIHFQDQTFSQEKVLDASIDQSLATIDLSSASDRLSTRLVEYLFQGHHDLLNGLHACRSRSVVQEISESHPRVTLLRKFAPMGSACTFPVQSIAFTLLAYFAMSIHENVHQPNRSDLIRWSRQVTVFGDDIIVPNGVYETIVGILHSCGLKVNTDKSFKGVAFRESCGMDAFRGVDVTPAYYLNAYDGSPTSMATTIETSNNLFKKGFWRASQAVVSTLKEQEQQLLAVIGSEVGGLGLYSFCGHDYSHLKVHYDHDLQSEYVRPLGLSAKVDRTQGSGLSGLTQYFTEKPDPMLPWGSGKPGVVRIRKCRTRVYPRG